ncbi:MULTISPECIES: CbtB-domain containing protein [Nocardiaceae]|uniref:Putative cobalt transporter subunit CbtB n=2 Tax=Williamsia limnetica TaxID=882452 RepID=A0A318REY9_WILLI|nr:CbtB-domain containing protein [Williamsia limnetica]PYE11163.1 putative cobalt transporter subunit CbtB [Williamsia limnetica]
MSTAAERGVLPQTLTQGLTLDTPTVSAINVALMLTMTTVLALLAYYFLGYDQGAVSVFGSDTHVHEFVHDSRHFLGFPCH